MATVVLTGASSGIGAAAARQLAGAGHEVVPLGRDPDRTSAVAREIGASPVLIDLGDLGDVRRAAAELLARPGRIDVLALNAGAMFPTRQVTDDGIEATLQTNHLGHFLLERLLHDRLVEERALVLFTCSFAVHFGSLRSVTADRSDLRYRMMSAYADSKLAGLLFIRELARRAAGTGLTARAFHPGFVNTRIVTEAGAYSVLARMPISTPQQAASSLTRFVTDPLGPAGPQRYFGPGGRTAVLPPRARDAARATRVWSWSEHLVGIAA
jgi:NAD(P)-dependent dehydrogenase (short-subunit alcohol dehydrogenase family)